MKEIPGFSNYLADENGKIYKKKTNKIIKPFIRRGYYRLTVKSDNGEFISKNVHALMCLAFYGERKKWQVCRHLNGIKLDNRIKNLKYGTVKENSEDGVLHGSYQRGEKHYESKLNWEKVCFIRKNHKAYHPEFSGKALAKKFGIRRNMIERILNKKIWKKPF